MEKKCANSNQVQKQHSLKRKKDLKWILGNQDCARHPYREARRFFLSPETKPERRGLLENSKSAMGQRSSSQGLYRCADSSGKHADRGG